MLLFTFTWNYNFLETIAILIFTGFVLKYLIMLIVAFIWKRRM